MKSVRTLSVRRVKRSAKKDIGSDQENGTTSKLKNCLSTIAVFSLVILAFYGILAYIIDRETNLRG